MKLFILPVFLLLVSCGNSSKNGQEQSDKTELTSDYSQFLIFHDKLKVVSPVKPLEQDATTTVSKLALSLYSDIKKYSFTNVFDNGGMIEITVAEFKKMDNSFSEQKYFDDLLSIYKNNPKFRVVIDEVSQITQHNFKGHKTTAQLFVSDEKSSMIYINLLSDKKKVITSIGIYDEVSDLNIIEKIIGSIKINN